MAMEWMAWACVLCWSLRWTRNHHLRWHFTREQSSDDRRSEKFSVSAADDAEQPPKDEQHLVGGRTQRANSRRIKVKLTMAEAACSKTKFCFCTEIMFARWEKWIQIYSQFSCRDLFTYCFSLCSTTISVHSCIALKNYSYSLLSFLCQFIFIIYTTIPSYFIHYSTVARTELSFNGFQFNSALLTPPQSTIGC